MSYVHIVRTANGTLDSYDALTSEIGPTPIEGMLHHYAGEVDGALVIVDIWNSRSDSDRFAAERLYPAFAAVGVEHHPATEVIAYDVRRTR